MHKKALLFATMIGLIAAPSFPQSTAERGGTLTIAPSFVSDYMDNGTRLSGFSFQPTAEYSRGPLTLGLFANLPISNKVPGSSDPEFDLSAARSWDIVQDLLSMRLGACLYAYPRANKDDGFFKSTFEPRIALDSTIKDTDLSLDYYYDVTMKGWGLEFGFNRLIPI